MQCFRRAGGRANATSFVAAQKAADADTPDDMAEDQVALQIEQSYSFKRIRSWNNEELFVELEIVTKGPFAPSLPYKRHRELISQVFCGTTS